MKRRMACVMAGIMAMGTTAYAGDMVPLRETAQSMGYTVGWSATDKAVTLTREGESITLKAGSNVAERNGSSVELSAPVEIRDGITYIPASAVEALGLKADMEGRSLAYRINAQMDEDTNYVFSPYSYKTAMAMLANAVTGEAREEILSALGYDSVDALNEEMTALRSVYTGADVPEEDRDYVTVVNSANSLWAASTCPPLNEAFTNTLKDSYGADTYTVTPQEYSVKAGEWIREKSEGMQDIQPTAPDEFLLSLINTLYLKADWAQKFEPEATAPGEFTNADGSVGQVEYMHGTFGTSAYVDENITMVKLPYRDISRDKRLSFYAAMGVGDMEDYIDRLEYKEVILTLPKLDTTANADMMAVSKALGINKVFTEEGDFSPALGDAEGGAYVSSILQDTIIELDEEGTRAASTTRVTMVGSLAEPQYIEIDFNKPFTYLVRDDVSGEILFMGRFAMAE